MEAAQRRITALRKQLVAAKAEERPLPFPPLRPRLLFLALGAAWVLALAFGLALALGLGEAPAGAALGGYGMLRRFASSLRALVSWLYLHSLSNLQGPLSM